MMKLWYTLAILVGLVWLAPHLCAQEKAAPENKNASAVLKLQVTIAEQEGEKKLANLPYSFFMRAGDGGPTSPWTKIRMGNRVPVMAGKDSYQYIDVGTNIDARAVAAADSRFDIFLNLERSWVGGEGSTPADKSATGEVNVMPAQPIVRQFKSEMNLTMHDGQTIQSTQATDPVSGRILTVTVTMAVVK